MQNTPTLTRTVLPPTTTAEQIAALRAELIPLLYGFKEEEFPSPGIEIDRLKRELAKVMRLGFGSDRTLVFVNEKYGGLWYTMKGDDHFPIKEPFLYGYIRRLEFKERELGSTPTHHLRLTVEADRIYVLVTGYNNHFSKGLIAAIAQARVEQLREPVWIQPQKSKPKPPPPGEKPSKSVILCNLHQNGELLRGHYSKELSNSAWNAMTRKAMENLQEASND